MYEVNIVKLWVNKFNSKSYKRRNIETRKLVQRLLIVTRLMLQYNPLKLKITPIELPEQGKTRILINNIKISEINNRNAIEKIIYELTFANVWVSYESPQYTVPPPR